MEWGACCCGLAASSCQSLLPYQRRHTGCQLFASLPRPSLPGDAAVVLGGANGLPPAAADAAAGDGGGADAAAAPAEAAGSGEWAEEVEVALVKALKRVGKEVADRWDQVAALVPGKTKAQCFRRFKEMKEAHKAKKGAPASKKK